MTPVALWFVVWVLAVASVVVQILRDVGHFKSLHFV